MAGPDTGQAGLIGGFGDLRDVELLVDGEVTPAEAIRIASRNGAEWLGVVDKVGTVQAVPHFFVVRMRRTRPCTSLTISQPIDQRRDVSCAKSIVNVDDAHIGGAGIHHPQQRG